MAPGSLGRFATAQVVVGREKGDDEGDVEVSHTIYYAGDVKEENAGDQSEKSRALFLANLPPDWTESQIKRLTGQSGEVIPSERQTAKPIVGYKEPPAMPQLYGQAEALHRTGGRARLNFTERSTLQKVLKIGFKEKEWNTSKSQPRLGLQRYLLNHASSTPNLDQIQAHASSWLETYESLSTVPFMRTVLGYGAALGTQILPEDLRERVLSGRLDLLTPADLRRFQQFSDEAAKREKMEEDGFTVVGAGNTDSAQLSKKERRKGVTKDPGGKAQMGFVAGGAAGRGTAIIKAARRDIADSDLIDGERAQTAKKKKTLKNEGLVDFYKFQTRQGRRNDLDEMRKRFAQDRQKIAAMKDAGHT